MSCKNKICRRAIYSRSISLVTIAGTDNLVIDIPAGYYEDGGRYCLFVTQPIPAANWNVPVSISIGGVTTTVFPLVGCNCNQIIVKQLDTDIRYPVRVNTFGAGSFKVLDGMRCCPTPNPSVLTVPTNATPTVSQAAKIMNDAKQSKGD